MTRESVSGKYYEIDGGYLVGVSAYLGFDDDLNLTWYGASGGIGYTIGASFGYGVTRMGLMIILPFFHKFNFISINFSVMYFISINCIGMVICTFFTPT